MIVTWSTAQTDAALAWGLVHLCESDLSPAERSGLSVTLDAGDFDEAIAEALGAVYRRRLALPDSLAAHARMWVDANPVHAHRILLSSMPTHPSVRFHTQTSARRA